jgi:hypothetical protein
MLIRIICAVLFLPASDLISAEPIMPAYYAGIQYGIMNFQWDRTPYYKRFDGFPNSIVGANLEADFGKFHYGISVNEVSQRFTNKWADDITSSIIIVKRTSHIKYMSLNCFGGINLASFSKVKLQVQTNLYSWKAQTYNYAFYSYDGLHNGSMKLKVDTMPAQFWLANNIRLVYSKGCFRMGLNGGLGACLRSWNMNNFDSRDLMNNMSRVYLSMQAEVQLKLWTHGR